VIEYFDSHCHLTDAAFRDDREAVLLRASEVGVTRLVTIASNVDDARHALELARAHAGVWCTAGVHPHEAGGAAPADIDAVRGLAASPEVVAIGETGLDFHYDHAPRGIQRDLFEAHLALGAEIGLPVVVVRGTWLPGTTAVASCTYPRSFVGGRSVCIFSRYSTTAIS